MAKNTYNEEKVMETLAELECPSPNIQIAEFGGISYDSVRRITKRLVKAGILVEEAMWSDGFAGGCERVLLHYSLKKDDKAATA